jgi:hypothetical protein
MRPAALRRGYGGDKKTGDSGGRAMMQLSEAIREGAQLRPQCRMQMFLRLGDIIHSCALGAAYEGAGYVARLRGMEKIPITLDTLWPKLSTRVVVCPVSGCPSNGRITVRDHIAHLNDEHNWSREQIAEWLEGQGF